MKRIITLPIAIFLISFSINAFSQSVDDIIDKYVKTVDPDGKLLQTKTFKITAAFTGMGADFPVGIVIKRDHKVRMDMDFQGQSLIQAYDGTTGWQINPFTGKKDAEKMTPEEVKEMKDQSEIEGKLYNYKDKGSTAELMGKEDMEGNDTYKIKLTDKDGDITYFYIDSQSYLVIKESTKRKFKEKEISSDTFLGNYQQTGGISFPMSMEVKTEGMDSSEKVTLQKIELNTDIDDSLFTMPIPKN